MLEPIAHGSSRPPCAARKEGRDTGERITIVDFIDALHAAPGGRMEIRL